MHCRHYGETLKNPRNDNFGKANKYHENEVQPSETEGGGGEIKRKKM